MPWTPRPITNDQTETNQLIRVPANKTIVCVATGDDLTGCDTHYYRGRTRPCRLTDCEPCSAGMMPRWHGYLSVVGTTSGAHVILELTPSCCPIIDRWLENHASLRGAQLTLRRANGKSNGKLLLAMADGKTTGLILPAALNIRPQLERLWLETTDQPSKPPATYNRVDQDPKRIGEILNGNSKTP